MKTPILFLTAGAVALLPVRLPAAAPGAGTAGSRPNILFIMVDEMRWDALTCAGHPFVRTPHLDALAHEGTRFASAYAELAGPQMVRTTRYKLIKNAPRRVASDSTRRTALKLLAAAATGGLAARAFGAETPSPAAAPGTVSLGDSSAYFSASDPTLPHGGVRGANTGVENSAALEALFERVQASKTDRKFVQMPAGTVALSCPKRMRNAKNDVTK